ncbi:hypothetical protein JD844_021933 [Phrynosoma platyrhinos]|uniref:VWFD domain-containing protein n=1 Tax=Phrynosoma platyrhinos TaxID=52577 RepID=A0ABQ7SU80_PHRPL|nr:hypothetical protein JD844_021933 [Phrynosoma platyrhinos]
MVGETVSIAYVTMRLDGVDVQLEPDAITVNGERVELPYSGAGFSIEKSVLYIKVTLELDEKYANQTCGLCGDFNGIRTYNEFISNGAHLTDLQFGNIQKLNGPTEDCEDPIPFPLNNCTDVYDFCREILTGSAFSQCNEIVWVEEYIDICVQDLCLCNESNSFSCLCATFAEYSRQCDHAGGQPGNWRTPELCLPALEASGTAQMFHVLACDNNLFTVLGELRRCGLTETETCLKMVTLNINGGETTVVIKPNGDIFLNWIYTQLPISAANVTIFSPSSFFIIVKTSLGLQLDIQLTPIMQLYIHLDPSFKERTCGLCGNFDGRETDDFRVLSGVVEGTAAAFANTWKTQSACPNIKHKFEDPCSLSIENERYANHWCGLLTDSDGPFAKCHPSVNPAPYHKNCMFDTCNCEKSEDCMCAALSSYVRACAVKGIELPGWRTTVCSKYINSCPQSQNYSYTITTCQPTCRSLSEPDVTCNVKFVPVDGCTCQSGTYLDDSGKCVPANKCPCYYKGNPILTGEVLHDLGAVCGLVSDGKGGCIPMEECPCVHNDVTYKAGEKIKIDCNTCVCKNRMWKCTKNKCLGTCAVYGDGHYITFDDKRYIFNGKCEYTLVQDHCGQNSSTPGTFRIITENVPCGTTGTTCSKTIKIFLENYELILSEEHHELIQRGEGDHPPYRIRYMGIYLVIETYNGLIILWDRKTTIFIKLSADFRGQVCGLCGNYDGNGINDFTTRSQSVVGDVLEFGNSWKVSPTCPDAKCTKNPCSKNPYRKSWSQKQCSIINSKVFAACHSQVDPTKYYEACVTDSCACDAGGDCECFCTAVAAYAQACSEFGVCISWRSPSICPLFCDYYNAEGECDWHYKPCGAPCMKTCRNPSGRCLHHLPGLEGCYPYCPSDKPYFSEDEMSCVDVCGCYDVQGHYYPPGKKFYSRETCQSCQCTSRGIECSYDSKACYCYYEGKTYIYRDVIYNTTDGLGWCMIATCDVNGTINRELYKCAGSTPTTPFTFTTVSATTQSEAENKETILAEGGQVCEKPEDIQCRAEDHPDVRLEELPQKVTCNLNNGLICWNAEQTGKIETCLNFQVRYKCCDYSHCKPGTTAPVPTTATTTTIEGSTPGKSTPPASSKGSTPAPPVPTMTHSTTVVSTAPAVTGAIKTPGVTPGKGSTVPATSLQSTLVSKPTPNTSSKPVLTVSIPSSSPTFTTGM